MTAAGLREITIEIDRDMRRRGELTREFCRLRERIERLAARIEQIAATDRLFRYQPSSRPDGTIYDAAAGTALAAAVRRRMGLDR